ncbi:hypothetical protein ABGB16_18450 [Micromonospora sp. B11E3]|uniref:hypothetical protein n=1 Tax=Micromonospora sp. B11E3 TaxID=3153562 RepID=UPI00325F5666
MLAAVARIARAVPVPVTADLERGYGLRPTELVERLLSAGPATRPGAPPRRSAGPGATGQPGRTASTRSSWRSPGRSRSSWPGRAPR